MERFQVGQELLIIEVMLIKLVLVEQVLDILVRNDLLGYVKPALNGCDITSVRCSPASRNS
jgi:hypothetical protein